MLHYTLYTIHDRSVVVLCAGSSPPLTDNNNSSVPSPSIFRLFVALVAEPSHHVKGEKRQHPEGGHGFLVDLFGGDGGRGAFLGQHRRQRDLVLAEQPS